MHTSANKSARKSFRLSTRPKRLICYTALPHEYPGIYFLDDSEIRAVVRVLKRRSLFRYYGLAEHPEVQSFENEFASFIGVSHALAVTSGTAALHTALACLGVGPGQEVIVPAYMWVSVIAAVVNLGAIPVLADIDETFGLNAADVKRRITPRTTGIIAVHMSGGQTAIEPLVKLARAKGLFLLEDCAQSAGGSIQDKKLGTFGDIAIFSTQINKNLTSGEGGCVVTNNAALYRRAIACHDGGYVRDTEGREILDEPDLWLWGRGSRMDELRGAILRVQLKKLPRIIEKMRASKRRIRTYLEEMPQLKLRSLVDPDGDTGSFLITMWRDAETARKVAASLRIEGLVTSRQGTSNIVLADSGLHIYHNIPSLVQKTSADKLGSPWNLKENAESKVNYSKGTCPVADELFERSVLVAIPSCLTEREEDNIIRAFVAVTGQAPLYS